MNTWLTEEDYIVHYGGVKALTIYNDTHCGPINWMNYYKTGWVSGNRVYKNSSTHVIDSFLFQCDEDHRLGPFRQKSDNTFWIQAYSYKMDSNLDIWALHMFGCDDAACTKHYLSELDLQEDINRLKFFGVDDLDNFNFFNDC